jgi:hypothetical protein
MGLKILFYVVFYVKERVKLCSYLTLVIKLLRMYMHPRHLGCIDDIKQENGRTVRLNLSL